MKSENQYSNPSPYLSIVIPVYNEEENLKTLCTRLIKSLDALDKSYEIIFTNDGSKDRSLQILREFHKIYPQRADEAGFGCC